MRTGGNCHSFFLIGITLKSPGLLESSDLPVVTRNRMQELKKALEQRLQTRPRIADLKHAGIYQSRESIF